MHFFVNKDDHCKEPAGKDMGYLIKLDDKMIECRPNKDKRCVNLLTVGHLANQSVLPWRAKPNFVLEQLLCFPRPLLLIPPYHAG
jgi:hypothetical protein